MSANRPQIETFGCRLNIWESEVMREKAQEAGLRDAIIFNTCAVTAEAEKQARQSIRKWRRERPDAKIIVTGCAAQIDPQSWHDLPEVDHVVGNHDKLDGKSWQALQDGMLAPVHVSDVMTIKETASHFIEEFDDHSRAFLQVQQGCDHRCTFCIIPYGRGPSRSVGVGAVVESVQKLVQAGTNEVVLTGVDITSWGHDLPNQPRLGYLVKQILKFVPDLPRLRLSSLDPAEPDHQLMEVIATEDRLMPHLHLSVQHGDDLVLKQMKRRHLARDVVRFVEEVRRRRPDVVFGADLIAGFPTEDEAAHEQTIALIEKLQIPLLHVFGYSAREGTPAAKLPQIDGTIIKARSKALRECGKKVLHDKLDKMIGSQDEILVEAGNQGHLRSFYNARLTEKTLYDAGQILRVKITGRQGDHLLVTPLGGSSDS
ncbi:MAG: tRNA (N(6)-L-threonylcarbamoyladenosine(37)-C(2))-methylthiotransferase MtaB [Candidatus Puniceispirillaceae bacterium]